jgi:hypothetical protein
VSGFLRFSSVVAAACLVEACFPSFEGLSGGQGGGQAGGQAGAAGAAAGAAGGAGDFAPDSASVVSDAASVVVDGTEMLQDASTFGGSSPGDAGGDDMDAASETVPTCEGGCPGKGYCLGSDCVYASCKDRKEALHSPSGVYWIDPDLTGSDPPFLASCGMNVSDGGWTLLMKVDGNSKTFDYDSPLWQNSDTYQPSSPAFDLTEAKLASYSRLPFANLLVGLRVGTTIHFALLAIGGSSLRDLMASGYHPSALGRGGWETISEGSLQAFCNMEGVNVSTPMESVRLGIVANESNDCNTCDSFVGFGGRYQNSNSYSCGNLAQWSPDHGDRHTPLFGYILAR